jgi:hypothetical protein
MVTGFHHRDNQDTMKDLPSAVLVSFLEPSVDVLRQYSLPNMDLRRAIYLIIALLPNHGKILVDLPLKGPVRPPFRLSFPEGSGHPRSDPVSPSGPF